MRPMVLRFSADAIASDGSHQEQSPSTQTSLLARAMTACGASAGHVADTIAAARVLLLLSELDLMRGLCMGQAADESPGSLLLSDASVRGHLACGYPAEGAANRIRAI